jgi:fatty acid-binding protein DegV
VIVDRSTTALVVDSTADLPENLLGDPNLTMVPLTVFFGEESYLDGVELSPERFYEKLVASPRLPTTRPSPLPASGPISTVAFAKATSGCTRCT